MEIYLNYWLVLMFYCCVSPAVSTKLLCHYNSSSYLREGVAKMEVYHLEPALELCTHLIYGHVGINPDDFKVRSLNPSLDEGCGHFRRIAELKQKFPHLKVLLSVGGGVDLVDGKPNPAFLDVLQSNMSRLSFINSAHVMVQKHGFDGIDLAWQFPTTFPIVPKTGFASFVDKVKTFLGANRPILGEWQDSHDYRIGFTALLEELSPAFMRDQLVVSVTILPSIQVGFFFEFHKIFPFLDLLTLPTYDLWTPSLHPDEAFHPAWLKHHDDFGSIKDLTIYIFGQDNEHVNKTIFAIQTYGRTWKLETGCTRNGAPPIYGLLQPGTVGPVTQTPGFLSYPEICANLEDADNRIVQYERLPLMRGNETNGAYAFRFPDSKGENGIWIGYQDPSLAGEMAGSALEWGAAGVAVVDLGYDDFRGTCGGENFAILRAVKSALDVSES